MDIEQELDELREEKAKQQRIQQRLTQIRQDQKEFRESGIKKNRKIRRGKRSRSVENDLENAPPASSDIITLEDDTDNNKDFNKRRDRVGFFNFKSLFLEKIPGFRPEIHRLPETRCFFDMKPVPTFFSTCDIPALDCIEFLLHLLISKINSLVLCDWNCF